MAYRASVFCFVVLGFAACVGDDPVVGGADSDAGSSSSGATSSSSSGSALDPDAGDAAATGCNLLADFQTPVAGPFASLNSSDRGESGAWLSNDELVVYYAADPGGAAFSADLYRATRASRSQPFGEPVRLPDPPNDPLSGAMHLDLAPVVAAGELTMYFTSDRKGSYDIWRSVRDTATAGWGTPQSLLSSDGGAESPSSLAGDELWYASDPGDGGAGVYSVKLTNGNPGAPVAHPELGPGYGAVLSQDRATVYFSRVVDADFGQIFVATRTMAQGPFANVAQLANVNSIVSDYPTWLSPDGCRLYLTSAREGGLSSLYVAERPPKP